MKIIVFVLSVIIILIFFALLAYSLKDSNNKVVGYRVQKIPIPDEETITKRKNEFEELSKKYQFNDCESMCKSGICCDYDKQMVLYNKCKECRKRFQCYDPNKNKCFYCSNFPSCEKAFGCQGGPPISPEKNYCYKCWGDVVVG